MPEWIGVDFDGTLAHSDTGEPIQPMVDRVKEHLKEGKDVRILTARDETMDDEVKEFCKEHFGCELPITNQKDHEMERLYDDKAVQVEKNTGRIIEDKPLRVKPPK